MFLAGCFVHVIFVGWQLLHGCMNVSLLVHIGTEHVSQIPMVMLKCHNSSGIPG